MLTLTSIQKKDHHWASCDRASGTSAQDRAFGLASPLLHLTCDDCLIHGANSAPLPQRHRQRQSQQLYFSCQLSVSTSATMAELQNANPTILNLSELPTRRRQKQSQRRPDDDLTTFSPRPPHWAKVLHETFEGFESKSVSDSSDAEDPIDEQEIFGTLSVDIASFLALFSVGYPPRVPLCPAASAPRYAVANKSCRFLFHGFSGCCTRCSSGPDAAIPGSPASGFMGRWPFLKVRFHFSLSRQGRGRVLELVSRRALAKSFVSQLPSRTWNS